MVWMDWLLTHEPIKLALGIVCLITWAWFDHVSQDFVVKAQVADKPTLGAMADLHYFAGNVRYGWLTLGVFCILSFLHGLVV